jgi:hypothetical protein
MFFGFNALPALDQTTNPNWRQKREAVAGTTRLIINIGPNASIGKTGFPTKENNATDADVINMYPI